MTTQEKRTFLDALNRARVKMSNIEKMDIEAVDLINRTILAVRDEILED